MDGTCIGKRQDVDVLWRSLKEQCTGQGTFRNLEFQLQTYQHVPLKEKGLHLLNYATVQEPKLVKIRSIYELYGKAENIFVWKSRIIFWVDAKYIM